MEDCNLTKQLNTVLEENIRLKQENQKLRENLKMQKTWNGIKEGYLIPIFRNKYGEKHNCLYSNVLEHIRGIIKEYLGINKVSEINENNYDSAKEMAIALTNVFCEHEWEHFKEMQQKWTRRRI